MNSETTSAVTIDLSTDNNNGEVACVVLGTDTYSQAQYDLNENKPSGEQVWLGLDAFNMDAVSTKKVDSADASGVAITEVTVDGLARGTKYTAFCTATNGSLVWPSFVAYNS